MQDRLIKSYSKKIKTMSRKKLEKLSRDLSTLHGKVLKRLIELKAATFLGLLHKLWGPDFSASPEYPVEFFDPIFLIL